MIEISNISKSYNHVLALVNVSFTMQQGEIVGLLGVNGSGKSTLMKILAGIVMPDKGDYIFNKKDFLKYSLDLKKKIGYLSEDNPLYEEMYVKEYLVYVSDIYKTHKERINWVIENTGLQNEYKKKINTLSKGNRQRLGIAQALINDPDFLILDEPSSGLDPNQREKFNELLISLSKQKIILFSTHILSEVENICTRCIILDKGKLVVDSAIQGIDSITTTFKEQTSENKNNS